MAEAAGIQLVAGSELQEKFQRLASDEDSQSDNVEETHESVENSSDEEPENSEENSSEEVTSKGNIIKCTYTLNFNCLSGNGNYIFSASLF